MYSLVFRLSMRHLSDEDLLERIGHGDESACQELFERYQTRLYNFIMRTVGEEMIADRNVFRRLSSASRRKREASSRGLKHVTLIIQDRLSFSAWMPFGAQNVSSESERLPRNWPRISGRLMKWLHYAANARFCRTHWRS